MFLYYIRPCYGSDKLLIEFANSPTDSGFSEALKDVFKRYDVDILEKIDSFDDIFYKLKCKHGIFEISSDNWGGVFIHADDDQEIISYLDHLLSSSLLFEKKEQA